MLLKAVSSCLHSRRPSRGCPGNLTSCISQSVTCQCLHSSNIINVKKNQKNKKKPKITTQRAPPMSLCGALAIRRLQVSTHALLLFVVGAMEEPQQAEQASWAAARGEANILGVGFAKEKF